MTSKKLIVIGEIGVGKTSLVTRFVHDKFTRDYMPTMGADIYRYQASGLGDAERGALELVIWDIDGNFGQSVFRHAYSKGASGALIVGDVTRAPTLDHMVALARDFEDYLPGRHYAFLLNKIDAVARPSEVALPEALRDSSAVPHWTSAATGAGVREAFLAAAEAILRRET